MNTSREYLVSKECKRAINIVSLKDQKFSDSYWNVSFVMKLITYILLKNIFKLKKWINRWPLPAEKEEKKG